MHKQKLEASLKFSKGEEADPYIYFYEDFLKEYDHKQKIESGVYYTPPAIVQCIVKNLDDILKQDFQLSEGLSDISVKALDFACGTGTFLFEIYKMILGPLDLSPEKKDLQIFEERLITKHILENIYGFEWLIPAYCVSHLKLSQYLKQKEYTLKENQRIPVYLTNTLEENRPHPSPFLEAITEEIRISYSIKKEKDILIITGNPPYNVKSKNHITGNLIDFHENYKPKDEKNINILSDDYIKFIAFAHHKIQQTGSGAIGIIVNNSFLSGLTHIRMRNQLRKDFEKIYILNLRGSGSVMNGIRDENVFDIQQEVCLVWFIKNPAITQKGVFYKEITGSRDQKFQQLATLNREEFQELKIDDFNQQFRLTQWGKNRFTDNLSFFYPIGKTLKPLLEYGKFWGMTEIFKQYSSGIQTARDHITIHFEKKSLREVLKKFQNLSPLEISKEFNIQDSSRWKISKAKSDIKNWKEENIQSIHYRPFDKRITYYSQNKGQGFLERNRNEIMQHLLYKENIGLVFKRSFSEKAFLNPLFVVCEILDKCFCEGQTYIAPLYLYSNFNANLNLEANPKKPNFHKTFWDFMQKQFQQPSPEEILGYIYGVLYSPQYRERYLELLKIDFPRIPFHISLEQFQHLSALGQQLIQAHLLQKVPSLALGKPKNEGKPNYLIEKPLYKEETQCLYFNTHCYFEDVPQSVWDFKIGGYQVLYKYLNGRKGRDISEDLEHITKVINILDFTLKTIAKIDQISFLKN